MGILTTEAILYIEFENVFFDTDTFVIESLYNGFNEDREGCEFTALLEKVDRNGIENLKYIGQVKRRENPIYDYLDGNILNKETVADGIYYSILYGDYGSPDIYNNLEMTSIGKLIMPITKDANFAKLYIYCKNPTPEICEFIFNLFDDDDRIEIITGDKGDFLSSEECTSYFLSDYRDLKYLYQTSKRTIKADVIIPEFWYNMDDTTLKVDTVSPVRLFQDRNIETNTTSLPIV